MPLGQLLRDADPASVALVWAEGSLTYGELDRRTKELACALLNEGLEPGGRVAVHWSNAVEAILLYFACFKAGLIAVPVNLRLRPAEIEHILRHSGATICFSEPSLAGVAEAAAAACGAGIQVRTQLPEGIPAEDLAEQAEDAVCAILYTSGTTALPKGVMHTHASLSAGARLTLEVGYGRGVNVTTTQMSHMSGFGVVLLGSMMGGATLVLVRKFDAAQILDAIERHGVETLLALPAQLLMVAEEQSTRPRRVNSIKAAWCGGDSTPEATRKSIEALFGVPAMEVLGMTESCPMIWSRLTDHQPGYVGKVRDCIGVKVIAEQESDPTLGELCVRSPANFKGYWNDAAATDAALADGWLQTGDRVRLDAEGYVRFEGRLKQVIKRESVVISPQEVEDALCRHPAVLEAGVIGLPDPRYGQKVVAFAALREGHSVDEQALRAAVAQHLAEYKVPETITFLTALPKGITGKVDRRALAEGTV